MVRDVRLGLARSQSDIPLLAVLSEPPLKRAQIVSNLSDKENAPPGENAPETRETVLRLRLAGRTETRNLLCARSIGSRDRRFYEATIAIVESWINEAQLELAAYLTKCRRYSITLSPDTTPGRYHDEIMDKLKLFGLSSFRLLQYEVITACLSGRDCMVLMPTGSGKSLTYQLPAICTSGKTCGLTVIVSPLLSLMEQQTKSLRDKDIRVVNASKESQRNWEHQLLYSLQEPVILYLTPEKLVGHEHLNGILDQIHAQSRLARFVIDEAHCISQWGRSFRLAYERLGEHIRKRFVGVPITALTGTATEAQILDISGQLRLDNPLTFRYPSNRANLFYGVGYKSKGKGSMAQALKFIQDSYPGQTGLVYCMTKKKTEQVAAYLRGRGVSAEHYHAGMSTQDRTTMQEKWLEGECHVIVATTAFGMGIDKPNVRFVLHFDLPRSMSEYIQETGRAGRDGLSSKCLLLFNEGDYKKLIFLIGRASVSDSEKEHQRRQVHTVRQYCLNADCRRVALLKALDERSSSSDCQQGCDNCVDEGTETVVLEHDFTAEAKELVEYLKVLQPKDLTVDSCRDRFLDDNGCLLEDFPGFTPAEVFDTLIFHLELRDVLQYHYALRKGENWQTQFIKLGPKALEFLENADFEPIVVRRHDWGNAGDVVTHSKGRPPKGMDANEAGADSDVYASDSQSEEVVIPVSATSPTSDDKLTESHNKAPAVVRTDSDSDDDDDDTPLTVPSRRDLRANLSLGGLATIPVIKPVSEEAATGYVSGVDVNSDTTSKRREGEMGEGKPVSGRGLDDAPTGHFASSTLLFLLRWERDKIMTEAEMASDWAGDHPIISDAALKALSLKCPGDYFVLRKVVSEAYSPSEPPMCWKRYEMRFVALCTRWRQNKL